MPQLVNLTAIASASGVLDLLQLLLLWWLLLRVEALEDESCAD